MIVVPVLSTLLWAGAVALDEKYDYIDSNFIAPVANLPLAQITVCDTISSRSPRFSRN